MSNIVLGLAAGLAWLAWLLPNHYPPWLAFHADIAMALAVLLVTANELLLGSPRSRAVPALCAVTCIASLIPLAQSVGGVIFFAGDAWMASLYLLGFGIAQWTGFTLARRIGAPLLFERVALLFLSASIVSVGLQLYQWLGITGLGIHAADLPPNARPFANLAQPNHLATLHCLGLVGALFLHYRGKLTAPTTLLVVGWLLLGWAMTGSRTVWAQLLMLTVWWLVMRRRGATPMPLSHIGTLVVAFVLIVPAWGSLADALLLSTGDSLQERLTSGYRLMHWRALLDAVADRPWLGFGWNQVSVAQGSTVLNHPYTGEVLEHSHNLLVDLLVWNGIPIGLCLIAALTWWAVRRVRACNDLSTTMLIAAIGGVFVHSLVEYPHDYAYFLLPTGLMIGAVDAAVPSIRTISVAPAALRLIALAAAGLTIWVAVEYIEIEANVRLLRFETARIGTATVNSREPDVLLLTQWREYLRFARTEPAAGMSAAQLGWMRQAADRYPYSSGQYRYAKAAALNGQIDRAAVVLARLCRMHTPVHCKDAVEAWQTAAQNQPQLASVVLPPLPVLPR